MPKGKWRVPRGPNPTVQWMACQKAEKVEVAVEAEIRATLGHSPDLRLPRGEKVKAVQHLVVQSPRAALGAAVTLPQDRPTMVVLTRPPRSGTTRNQRTISMQPKNLGSLAAGVRPDLEADPGNAQIIPGNTRRRVIITGIRGGNVLGLMSGLAIAMSENTLDTAGTGGEAWRPSGRQGLSCLLSHNLGKLVSGLTWPSSLLYSFLNLLSMNLKGNGHLMDMVMGLKIESGRQLGFPNDCLVGHPDLSLEVGTGSIPVTSVSPRTDRWAATASCMRLRVDLFVVLLQLWMALLDRAGRKLKCLFN